MSLNSLPDEILAKIFDCLRGDTKSIINLASSCRRLESICTDLAQNSASWKENRPIAFNFYLNIDQYTAQDCEKHAYCPDQKRLRRASCEVDVRKLDSTDGRNSRAQSNRPQRDPYDTDNDSLTDCVDEICYYHRIACLFNSKHRCYSSMKFKGAYLSHYGCILALDHSLRTNRGLASLRLNALVELELHQCDISLFWLNTVLNHLEKVKYLALDEVAFIDPHILIEPDQFASRILTQLKITGDRTCRINDSIFSYFLDNFPAICLDITSTRVTFQRRVIERFYHDPDKVDRLNPTENIFTFPMILVYLKKYQAVTKHFIANRTEITFSNIKRILLDNDLKHLKITIQDCPLFTDLERFKLLEHFEHGDLDRVIS